MTIAAPRRELRETATSRHWGARSQKVLREPGMCGYHGPMRRARHLLWHLLLAMGLCACKGPRAPELEQVCVIASEIRKDQSMDVAGHADQLAQRAGAEIPSPEFAALWSSIGAEDVDSRYDRLLALAAEQNMHGWTCITLRELWRELGEHQRLAAWDAAHPPAEGGSRAGADEPAAQESERKGEAKRKGKAKGKRRKGKRRK